MLINFDDLPESSRVWIYFSSKTLSEIEISQISDYLNPKVESWAAHGAALTAGYKIIENRFLVIGVNEEHNLPSGCSIDTSTGWIKDINQRFSIDFLDRSLVYLENSELKTAPIFQVKKFVENEIILKDTIVFNNLISKKEELETLWKIKASESFLSRYFLEQTV